MYCPHCGNQLDGQVTFCPFCGQRVAAEPTPDASAQPAAAYPGATAQYPAQAAYQQQAGQGVESQGAQDPAQQQPADAAQQPASGDAPQGQGQKKGPSAVTIALAVVAVVAVLALVLVVTGFVEVGGGDATEDQATEATTDATDDADSTDDASGTDDATADDADASADATADASSDTDATTDSSDTTIDDATDTSDDASGSSSASSGSAEATAAGLSALLVAEGFDDVYVSDESDYVEAYMYGDTLSDTWEFSVMIEEDGSLPDVDIYVYWPVDGDVEEGFAHADEVVAYVLDLLADGGYLDDWEGVTDLCFPDEFVAEAVEFAAGLTESDSFYESTETDEGYDLWLWYYYALGYDYVCMNIEVWR